MLRHIAELPNLSRRSSYEKQGMYVAKQYHHLFGIPRYLRDEKKIYGTILNLSQLEEQESHLQFEIQKQVS